MTSSGLTLKQLLIVIGCIIVVGLGSAWGVIEIGSKSGARSDNNGCVIKSVLNLGAYRSFTALEKPAQGTSAEQLQQTREAIPNEIFLAAELQPGDKTCKHILGDRYFKPRLAVVNKRLVQIN